MCRAKLLVGKQIIHIFNSRCLIFSAIALPLSQSHFILSLHYVPPTPPAVVPNQKDSSNALDLIYSTRMNASSFPLVLLLRVLYVLYHSEWCFWRGGEVLRKSFHPQIPFANRVHKLCSTQKATMNT